IGSAWWQGDCGPYWGHNAVVRIAPFMRHCELPVLAEGALVEGHVLSHYPVGAGLIRRAGDEGGVAAGRGATRAARTPTLGRSHSSVVTCAGAKATCSIGIFCTCRPCTP